MDTTLAEKGREFYNQNLKSLLEPSENGKFIAIEPISGRCFIGKTTRETKLQDVPPLVQERIFLKMFQTAEIAKYNPQERQAYQDSMTYYRDWKNVIDTPVDEAVTEAAAEEKTIFAKKLKNKGFAADEISGLTGLSLDEVNSIR